MKSILNIARIVAAILLASLAGCAQVESQREADAPAVVERPVQVVEAVALLHYAQAVRAMGGKEFVDELERLRQAHAADRSDVVALQYALALSVPGASVANQRRALQLLEPLALVTPAEGRSNEVQAVAALLRGDLLERRRLEDIAYVQTQKWREEQRRADELDKKVDALTKKLEALVNIERNLLRRDKSTRSYK